MMLNSKMKSVEIPEIEEDKVRKSTISKIEEITLHLIEEINSKNFPKVTYYLHDLESSNPAVSKTLSKPYDDGTLRGNLEDFQLNIAASFDSSRSLSWIDEDEEDQVEEVEAGNSQIVENEEEEDSVELTRSSTTVDFQRQRSRKNLVLIITVMSHVHKMLISGITRTRRSLYYELQNGKTVGLVKNQRVLDDAVNHVASLLERAPWELGFTATSKGLVCGDLSLTFSGQYVTSCDVPGGVLIPQNIFRLSSVRTPASYVLVVEKDAVFQKLLGENCTNCLNCILITGKGFPDINTRMLVSLLGNKLKIPVYVLVDADPFGIEIMCIYRFGSSVRSRENQELTCPIIRWVGIHPSEYSALGITPTILNAPDKSRLDSLRARSYMDENLLNELKIMSDKGKVEIETVADFSHRFLTTVYLPHKIHAEEFI